ncbi:MAG: hypothetical protein EAY75_11160 [Bacteroidetes bacterium]|nr:MAG: hypothetical protein EAY75_11160 [Bacteroidota bacterium]
MHVSRLIIFLALTTLLLGACQSTKQAADQFRYFDKNLDTLNTLVANLSEPQIREGDQLLIRVFSATLNQEQAALFNLNADDANGYVVDVTGSISMPVLGKIKVDGLTKFELEQLLIKQLATYIKNPVVNINFLNFRVLMLGEVTQQGFVKFATEKATVLDAIGLAGGLLETGLRTNILVIRQLPGGKKDYGRLNINDARIFASPYFQVQQNDVVYILPNDTRIALFKRSVNPVFRDLPAYAGLMASLLAIAAFIITLTR